jgi:uncharacterized metal-binding protein YceD (DUF177 family)
MKPRCDFSNPLMLGDLSRAPARLTLEANPSECALIAERLGLPSVEALSAKITVRRTSSRIYVQGTFTATFTQVCVVSLDPFDTTEEGEVDEEFLLTDDRESPEIDLDPDAVIAEPLSGDSLDIGELVIQNLSLSLDPHPRAPGAALSDLEFEDEQLGQPSGPFDQLRDLRLKQ